MASTTFYAYACAFRYFRSHNVVGARQRARVVRSFTKTAQKTPWCSALSDVRAAGFFYGFLRLDVAIVPQKSL
jgi:hypothetical protein